uniref:Site-2 protease family protein n=1 Tax=candidate division WOR-3 bacterium TaxID=2052148 RepID=A0A7C4CC67_UNCW3
MTQALDMLMAAPAILFGLTVHEFSHALVADRLGDPTARSLGRLTLNPLKHLDFIGTLALFFFRFGWAKPVPIDPRNFRHPTRDMALSSLAGPAANLLIAVVAGLVLRVLTASGVGGFFAELATYFVLFNLILCFFNLIPIPPLDGSRFVSYLLPAELAAGYARLEQFGFMILIGVIMVGSLTGVPILWMAIGPLVRATSWLIVGYPVV